MARSKGGDAAERAAADAPVVISAKNRSTWLSQGRWSA